MTFEEVMVFTRTISSHAAFEDEECEAYFNILMTLPKDSLIVEIGLEYGRSSSIALQVTKERKLRYLGIDPFLDFEIYKQWMEMAQKTGAQYPIASMLSSRVHMSEAIGCILIDGDHSYETVLGDFNHFLPNVVSGGYACLHDCGRQSLSDVLKAAKEYFGTDDEPNPGWEMYQQAGTLAIWRRR